MSRDGPSPQDIPEPLPQVEPSGFEQFLSVLPTGDTLPASQWASRHRAVLWVLFLHVPVLFALGLYGGRDTIFTEAVFDTYSLPQTLIETGVIALFGLIAAWPRLSRRIRGSAASLGLITSSAVLVQFSGGFIEAHFHFFVILALLALYEDWIPFLLGIGYVLVHHGTVGTIAPGTVYNHPTAIAHPWRWAAVHAFFITGLCAALTTTWRMSEDTRAERRRVLDAASDGILGLDSEGTITFANPTSKHLLGAETDEIVGRPLESVVRWADPDPDSDPRAALNGIEARSSDAQLLTLDGRTVPVEWVSRPVVERGRIRGAVLTLNDISEQKEIQAELRAHARRLERNNEEWEEFGSAVSHDLREPLRTVANYCEFVKRRYADVLDEDGVESLDYAISGVTRMTELLEGLHTFSQVGTEQPAQEDVDLESVAEDTRRSLELRISETDAEITVESLPSVRGHRSQLAQVFQNLIANAIKFRGKQPPRVRIWAKETEDHWEINVEDNGKGMDPHQVEKAFRMFERLDAERDEPGQGIGLAICKAVVNRHGGRIRAESEPGVGTRFIIELPKADGHQQAIAGPAGDLA